jgi:ABC-type dipeptide/oligopeptide/nickel transport system permease subunit
MSAVASIVPERPTGLPGDAWRRLREDRPALVGLAIVASFALVAVLAWLGLAGADWSAGGAMPWTGASAEHWFGTNRLGQDVFDRAVYSTGVAFSVGGVVAVLATTLGTLFGAVAGWRPGGWVDDAIGWTMGVLDSLPFYLFVAALAFALRGHPWAMQLAMIATFWTATARLVRAEVMRLRERPFVESALAIGLPGRVIVWRHVLPNTVHLLLVQGSLTFVAAIKTEVILSFLGLGIRDGVSWGLMLAESTQDVLSGHFGNFLAASGFLFILLLGVNLLTDALQDAWDVRGVTS